MTLWRKEKGEWRMGAKERERAEKKMGRGKILNRFWVRIRYLIIYKL